ncbi:hemolysin family protein [Candidatus Berkiella cookevillensis]|uniref:Hemolysin family protein n=1 Tax=Candidatus Berkiella cookevillensis TaxID=437022 RepID=A0A0Q9YU34_9GAMM|nr:hemolysin family protein [Candidatus Berkiella cookevillensis]MCS5707600.1 hemolysin family protein [Candidatus Berkiella cookevillensis]
MYDLFLLFLAILLVFLNAFFVAAEFSMVKLRHTRVQAIKNHYGLRGRILEQVHTHLDAYLSACQLGITLASLGLGWLGKPAFAHFLQSAFIFVGLESPELLDITSFFFAFFIISFLHIVVGELMPKSLAIRQSEVVSLWTATPLYGFYWLMYPAIWLLNLCSNFLLKVFGLDAQHHHENVYSSREIKTILNASHIHGELTEDEADIIEQTMDLADLDVTEIIRPAEEMVMIDITQPIDAIFQKIIEYRYSRYPVYDPEKKEIIGIIHVKDLFDAFLRQDKIVDLRKFIRPAIRIPHYLPALDLLHKFRNGMTHFALVYKGKHALIGFVTLDNLLQIMIGHIKDEFHRTQDDWMQNQEGHIIAKGKCTLYALEKALGCDITVTEEEKDVSTLAGLIIERIGKIPEKGETIHFAEFDALIEEVQGAHIKRVKVFSKIQPNISEDKPIA